jgi:hypothetical protein
MKQKPRTARDETVRLLPPRFSPLDRRGVDANAGDHLRTARREHGMKPAREAVHVHDFHTTILHLMGLDHTLLTFRYSRRDYRLTDVAGEVVRGLLA